MQRRTTTLAAALAALVLTATAACSSGTPGAASTTGGSGGSAGGSKTLTVLNYYTNPGQQQVLTEWYAKCKEETGYTFQSLTVPTKEEMATKAAQLTASGDAPGVIVADNQSVAGYADAGVLGPFDISQTSLKESDFVAGPFSAGGYNGVQYGLPLGNNGEVIIYNKDMLAAAGVTPPKSWADLQSAAKKLTTSSVYGFAQTLQPGETLAWNWVSQLWSNGGDLTQLDSQKSIDAAEFWSSFVLDKTAPSASLDWQATDIEAAFAKGQLAMGQVGTWVLPQLEKDAEANGLNYGITQQVSPDGQPPITPFGGEVIAAGVQTGDAAKAVNTCIGLFFEDPAQLATWDESIGYLPSYIPAQAAVLAKDPSLQVLADQLAKSRSRSAEVGPKYDGISAAISTAIAKIVTRTSSAADAMKEAQQSVK